MRRLREFLTGTSRRFEQTADRVADRTRAAAYRRRMRGAWDELDRLSSRLRRPYLAAMPSRIMVLV